MSGTSNRDILPLKISLNGKNVEGMGLPTLEVVKFVALITRDNSPIYKISEDQLLPNTRAQYDRLLKENPTPGQKPAIYVNPYIGHSKANGFASYINIPDMGLTAPLGKTFITGPVIFITEAGRRWTEKDAPPLLSEKEVLSMYPVFSPKNDEQRQIVEAFNKMALDKKLNPPPTLLVDEPNSSSPASALLSKEGKQFVLIKPSTPLKHLLAVAEHETAHFKNGDLTLANIVKMHNSSSLSVAAEKKADMDVIKACKAPDLSSLLKNEYLQAMKALGHQSLEQLNDYQKDRDPIHPLPIDRLKYLDAAIANPPPGCKPPSKARTP